MKKEIKILAKKNVHDGFNKIYEYEIQVPSLKPEKGYNPSMPREIVLCSDSVFVLIYAPDVDSFVFCQEFRMGVFVNANQDNPFMLQCVAGMIDRAEPPEAIARAEVKEETGLLANQLQLIAQVYSSAGRLSEKTHVFYTEVKGSPQNGIFGLESEHEEIATHTIKREEVYRMMDEFKIQDAMTLLALNWFRCHH